MRNYGAITSIGLLSLIIACDANSPGLEYMPDMYRSPAVETYVDNNEYGNTEEVSARIPVQGTIPRGFQPFGYDNSLDGYEKAGAELVNPYEASEVNLERGKNLYGMMCKHCHGAKGDGKGSITNAVYGAIPSYADANPTRRGNRAMKDLKAGHIYHTIMYGLNAMGSHASQVNEEERWKIVLYVQSMQGNTKVAEAAAGTTTN